MGCVDQQSCLWIRGYGVGLYLHNLNVEGVVQRARCGHTTMHGSTPLCLRTMHPMLVDG